MEVSTDYLIFAGLFTSVGGTSGFNSAGAVELFDPPTVQGDQAPANWVPDIYHSGTPEVHAIRVEGSDIYLGGALRGDDPQNPSHVVRELVRLEADPASASGTIAIDPQFDLGLATGGFVRAIARNSSGDFYLTGLFWVGGQPRRLLSHDGTSVVFTADVGQVGDALAIAVDGNDNMIVGGRFHGASEDAVQFSNRSGVAAFDSSGNLLGWAPNVLTGNPGDEWVRALMITSQTPHGDVLWIGGKYTGGTALSWSSGQGKDVGYFELPP